MDETKKRLNGVIEKLIIILDMYGPTFYECHYDLFSDAIDTIKDILEGDSNDRRDKERKAP